MDISVVIPSYNSSAFIQATLDSVLQQTVLPDEIIVLDDGSTDNTLSILNSYKPQITVIQQKNKGVASARNALSRLAKGELVAFLDHDDIWHPSYLEVQRKLFLDYPQAVAFFAGHVNFYGYGNYQWDEIQVNTQNNIELLTPVSFFKRYNQITGLFASMSYCAISRQALMKMGSEPFCVSGVDDSYLCNVLSLLGPVVYCSRPIVAYRIVQGSQSINKLKDFGLWVEVFQLLAERFRSQPQKELYRAFRMAFASKRRQYAKRLMGAGNILEARKQLCYSVRNSNNLNSMVKSFTLLFLTYMPDSLQPKWPPIYRE